MAQCSLHFEDPPGDVNIEFSCIKNDDVQVIRYPGLFTNSTIIVSNPKRERGKHADLLAYASGYE